MIQKIKIKDIELMQDTELQSITLDSVALADFVKINRCAKKVLEIGSGNGIISLLLAKKMKAKIVGVEILKKSYDLAIENANNNEIKNVEYINEDIKEFSKHIFQEFDIVVSNPPYFLESNENQIKKDSCKRIARNEENLKIEEIIAISNAILKNRGHLYLIFRVERLDEILEYLLGTKLVAKVLKFVYTKRDAKALLVLVDCIKGVKKGLVVEAPLNVYDSSVKEYLYK